MTSPLVGPIQPLSVPNVQTGYVDTSNPGMDVIHRGVKSLVDVLLAKQQQDFEQRKLTEETNQRVQQQAIDQQTGELLQQLLPALAQPSTPGVMGGTVPQVPNLMAAPVTVQSQPSNMVADKLTRAFAGKPGTVIQKASGIAANSISQAMTRETAQVTAKTPKATPDRLATYVNDKNELLRINETTGKAEPIIDLRTGQPVQAPPRATPGAAYANRSLMTNWVTPDGRPVTYNPSTGVYTYGPKNLLKTGPINQADQQAALFYREAAEGWKQIKELGPNAYVPADAKDFILGLRGAIGTSPAEKYIRESSLSDITKRTLLAWTTIIRGSIYSKSGKAVTIQEFQDALNRGIPLGTDSPKLRQSKTAFLQAYTEGLHDAAFKGLLAATAMGSTVPPSPAELFSDMDQQDTLTPDEIRAAQGEQP